MNELLSLMKDKKGENWPVYYSDTIHVSNKESGVCIVCLWTKKERIIEKVNPENYCYIGQLYSREYGLQILLRNLLANPHIKYLVVTGIDLNNSAQGLVNFFTLGVDANKKIKDTDIYLDDEITIEHVNILRNRIEFQDTRDKKIFSELNPILKNLIGSNKDEKEIILPLPKISPPIKFPGDHAGFKIRDTDFSSAYQYLLKIILRFGQYDKKNKQVFIPNLNFFVKKISDSDKKYFLSRSESKSTPKIDSEIEYDDEAVRTMMFEKIDCWDELKNAVKHALEKSDSNICIMASKAFLPEDKLEDAVEVVGYELPRKWNPDPLGNLVIRVEDGVIKVMHISQKGKSLAEFKGKSAKELYKKIAFQGMISMIYHGLDIGAELQKAEIALIEGKKYVQDKSI